jgi:hypothetical protein
VARSLVPFGLLLVVLAPRAFAEPPVTITHRMPAGFVPPSAPVATDPALLGILDRLDAEAAIRPIYDRFTAVARRVGKDVTFSLSNFQTYRASQFAELRTLQVRRDHGGPRISVSPSSFHGNLPSQIRHSYVIEWEGGDSFAETQNRFWADTTVAEVIRITAEDARYRPTPAVVGVTTFDVAVTFEGKTVSALESAWWGWLSPSRLFVSLTGELVNPLGVEDFGPEALDVPLEDLQPPREQPVADSPDETRASCIPVRPAAQFAIPPPPPRCEEEFASIVALELANVGPPKPLGMAAVPLTRREGSGIEYQGQPVSYLMAEWAIVEQVGDEVRVKAAPTFDESVAKEQANKYWSGQSGLGPKKVLLAALPTHEANSRQIVIPAVRLANQLASPTEERGKLLVYAIFDENHRLETLHAVSRGGDGIGSWQLLRQIENVLQLEPSPEHHRVVAFVLLSIGATIELESYLAYLPRCCCGTEFCT